MFDPILFCNWSSEEQALQRKIQATDQQIDALVYKLYGLTEEEVRIVEADRRRPTANRSSTIYRDITGINS